LRSSAVPLDGLKQVERHATVVALHEENAPSAGRSYTMFIL
jgi:hypothetical protein